jgi:uncharacterized surface protein with fasciclin (FAS1) repeats
MVTRVGANKVAKLLADIGALETAVASVQVVIDATGAKLYKLELHTIVAERSTDTIINTAFTPAQTTDILRATKTALQAQLDKANADLTVIV